MAGGHLAHHAFAAVAAVVAKGKVFGGLNEGGAVVFVEDAVFALAVGRDFLELFGVTQHVFVKKLGQHGFVQRLAVDGELFVQVSHFVAGHADHALDVVQAGLGRVAKDHHVAALGAVVVEDLGVDHRQAHAVMEFIDQDQVVDHQRRDHRTGRDLEGLKQERTQDEDHHDHRKETSGPVQPPGLHQQFGTGFGQVHFVVAQTLAAQLGPALRDAGVQQVGGLTALRQKVKALCQPVNAGHHGGQKQQQRKITFDQADVPGTAIAHKGCQHQGRD